MIHHLASLAILTWFVEGALETSLPGRLRTKTTQKQNRSNPTVGLKGGVQHQTVDDTSRGSEERSLKKGKAKTAKEEEKPGKASKKKGQSTQQKSVTVLMGSSSELSVVACGNTSVEITGTLAGDIDVGMNFVYFDDNADETVVCGDCSPLFRKIVDIKDSTGGIRLLATQPLAISSILSAGMYNHSDELGSALIEPAFGCAHSSFGSAGASQRLLDRVSRKTHPVTPFPATCSEWLDKQEDKCTYTNCYVGEADPKLCFSCGSNWPTGCYNAFGSSSGLLLRGDLFSLFNFGSACCIHDYCYSSTYSKSVCDEQFYMQMKATCPAKPETPEGEGTIMSIITFGKNINTEHLREKCFTSASILYAAATSKIGTWASQAAVKEQVRHELDTDICGQGLVRQPLTCSWLLPEISVEDLKKSAVASNKSSLVYHQNQAIKDGGQYYESKWGKNVIRKLSFTFIHKLHIPSQTDSNFFFDRSRCRLHREA